MKDQLAKPFKEKVSSKNTKNIIDLMKTKNCTFYQAQKIHKEALKMSMNNSELNYFDARKRVKMINKYNVQIFILQASVIIGLLLLIWGVFSVFYLWLACVLIIPFCALYAIIFAYIFYRFNTLSIRKIYK